MFGCHRFLGFTRILFCQRMYILCFMKRETLYGFQILLHCKCILRTLSPNFVFHSQIIMLPMSVNPMLLQSTHLCPLQEKLVLSNLHELMKIVDNELKKTAQTFTRGPPSVVNSSKENNASTDIGVIQRMTPSRPQSTQGKFIFNFNLLVSHVISLLLIPFTCTCKYILSTAYLFEEYDTSTNFFVYNIGRSGF